MCYYVSYVPKKKKVFIAGKELELSDHVRPLQSGFEYGNLQIIRKDSRGEIVADMAHWELIPFWYKNIGEVVAARQKFTTLNATGENLFERKTYKQAAEKRRCLVPVTGFFEWRHYRPEGAKKDQAYPYYIEAGELAMLAGIWQPWTDQESGETINTMSIVTTEANELMRQIHNTKLRMPTILTPELQEEWLSEIPISRIKEIATHQYDSEEMQAYNVSKDFREALNPLEEFDYEELPGLFE